MTTNAGAEALLNCQGLETLLVPSDGRLDISGDVINVGDRAWGKPTRSGHPESAPTPTGQVSTVNLWPGVTTPVGDFPSASDQNPPVIPRWSPWWLSPP